MDIFESFATDEKLEVEGSWFPLTTKSSVLVGREGNTRYSARLRDAFSKNQIDLDAGGKDADNLADMLVVEVMADTILLGWKGLSYKGKAVEYSPEMARTMLRIKDFRKKVVEFSRTFAAYQAKAEEEQKNV